MKSRFRRKPGDTLMPSVEDETMAVIGAVSPGDTIRTPRELGDRHEVVQEITTEECVCRQGHDALHYKLRTVRVAECPRYGFLWYRKPGEEEEGE